MLDGGKRMNTSRGALAGAVSVDNDIWMYQLTEKGLNVSVTVTGAKYYKENSLNLMATDRRILPCRICISRRVELFSLIVRTEMTFRRWDLSQSNRVRYDSSWYLY
jgi:hypothetical protein